MQHSHDDDKGCSNETASNAIVSALLCFGGSFVYKCKRSSDETGIAHTCDSNEALI